MKSILLFLSLLSVGAFSLRAEEASFVGHPSISDSSLQAADVKAILLGNRTKWDTSGALKLAVLADGPLHDKVIQIYTQRSSDQFDKYWKKQVFTGKGVMPAAFKTEAELLDFVAKTPGAFGYVTPGAATAAVKVFSVQ